MMASRAACAGCPCMPRLFAAYGRRSITSATIERITQRLPGLLSAPVFLRCWQLTKSCDLFAKISSICCYAGDLPMFGRMKTSEGLASLATKAISANVMVADENLHIVYMNEAVKALLREAEPDLKKDLPRFNVDTLIGTNIDVFHKNPGQQRQLLQALTSVRRATIEIGKWSFDLVATPLKNADGRRAGVVVEWADASIRLQNLNFAAQTAAISRAQAVIEFNLDGTIITANENFLKALGYSLGEIQGKHHSMFVAPAERDGAAYREFWAALSGGDYQAGEYKRIGK